LKINTNKNLFTDFFKVFTDVNTGFSFRNLGYLPRWLILLLDIFIVVLAGVITFLLFQGLKLNYIHTKHITIAVVFI